MMRWLSRVKSAVMPTQEASGLRQSRPLLRRGDIRVFVGAACAGMRRGGLAAAIAAVALLALGLTAGRAHSQDNRVGLVVQYGDGSVFMGCYPWTSDLTGESLLRRAGLNVEADYDSGMGALICRIGADGCPASDCLCQAQTPPLKYWAYWRLDRARGDWLYSQQGSSNRALQPGDVDGWAWGVGTIALGARPPKVTFEQVCPPPTATPSPTLTYTITPQPTATHAPTATTAPPPVAVYLPTSTPPPTATAAASPTPAPTATTAPAAVIGDAASVVGEVPSATPLPTATPLPSDTPVGSTAALPTAASAAPPAAEVVLPSPTASLPSVGLPAAPQPTAPVGAAQGAPTATAARPSPIPSPAAQVTVGPGSAPTALPTATLAPRIGAAPPQRPLTAPPAPVVTVTGQVNGATVAQPPAGATVDLSRLTPAAGGANRGAVEGFNSGAPVGYIAFVGLVAGLGVVLWLRRRGDV